MSTTKRVLIASGGTGGHFYPGLALANELRALGGWDPLFLVKKADLSITALQTAYYPYAEIDMTFLPRSMNPFAHLSFIWKFAVSFAVSLRIIRDFRPALVLGTGSYVSFPAVLAARLSGVPSMIHESNAKFGLANRLCAGFASRTALGLPIKDNPFAGKSELTGTPIREGFSARVEPAEARRKLGLSPGAPVLLVFGGSQGARRLNRAAASAVRKIQGRGLDLQILHIAGKRDYAETTAFYAGLGLAGAPFLKVMDYSEDMSLLYSAASLVCCRAGASTVTELIYLKKPAILVPLPSSAAGHQLANAKVLSAVGAASLIEESPAFADALEKELARLLAAPAELERLHAAFSGLKDLPDPMRAPANIVAEMRKLLDERTDTDRLSGI